MRLTNRICVASTLIATTCLIQACTVGPDYQRPDLTLPTAFKENADWKLAKPGQPIPSNWWDTFGDADLTRLEQQVSGNFSLAQAEAQFRQASASAENTKAGLFPKINVAAAYNRFVSPTGQNQIIPGIRQTFNTAITAAWELDLWGRIRRQVEAGEATAIASAATMQALKLSLQAQLAQNYFQLRSLDAQKQVLGDTVKAFAKTLELTRNRYTAGVVGKSDVVQAETQLTATEAQLADLDVLRSQMEHSIAVLIGKAPSELFITPTADLAAIPDIPPAIPSTLLERRPDIAAAEQQMIAANAQIGAAKAAFFPNVTLNFINGFQSSKLERLLTTASHYWALGPAAATLPLFEGGTRNAQLTQAIATHEATTAAYRQTILNGLKEVEDNLSALKALETEAQALDQSVKTGREAVELTTNQYKAGAVSFQNVLSAQTAALANERSAIGVHGSRLNAAVILVKALGGGWDRSALKDIQKDSGRGWRHYMPFPES